MRHLLVIVTLVLILTASGADAFDLITPRAQGMGRTAPLSYPSAAWQVNLPARGLAVGDWRMEGGYNRRFDLADLDHFLAFSYDSLSIGASISALQVQLGNDYGRLRDVTAGIGLSYRYRRLLVAVTVDNLTRPTLTKNSEKYNPVYSLYTELAGQGAYSLTGRVTLEELQAPQFALGQIIRLSRRGSFFWGISTAPLEFGGGLEVYIPSGSLSYATSVHPVLGFSHTVSFTYGSSRPAPKGTNEFE